MSTALGLSRRESTTLTLAPRFDKIFVYTANVTLGDTVYNVMYDTGSCSTWIYSGVSGNESTVELAETIVYMDGTKVSGYVSKDTITIGNVSVPDFRFTVATSVIPEFEKNYGIVGLCHKQKDRKQDTFNIKSYNDKKIDTPYMSFSIENNISLLSFGKVATNDTNWMTIDADSIYWTAKFKTIEFSNQTLQVQVPVMFDTGTSLMVLPLKVARDFANNLGMVPTFANNLELYTGSCFTHTKNVTFSMTDMDFILSDTNMQFLYEGTCYASFAGADIDVAVMGITFLQNYHTTFDMSANRIGFVSNLGNIHFSLEPEPKKNMTSVIVMGCIFSILGFVILLVPIVYCIRKTKKSRKCSSNV